MKVPPTYTKAARGPLGTMWTTAWVCRGCGFGMLHVELSPDWDEPDGLDLAHRICDRCGTEMVPRG